MATTYLQQRIHPAIEIGHTATVARQNRNAVIHVRQSEWSGSCGICSLAMALMLLGRLSSAADLPERRRGMAAKLWELAKPYYFDGITNDELADVIRSLDNTLYVKQCQESHRQCLFFALEQLNCGRLAIVSWLSKSGKDHHWTLVIGTEGLVEHRIYWPETMLFIDPGEPSEPYMCAHNARMQFADHAALRHKAYLPYVCASGSTKYVRLTSVISIGERGLS